MSIYLVNNMSNLGNMNIWVRINVNANSRLEGTDEFIKELKENYTVQYRREWYPSACEGTELILQFFIDTALGNFFSNVVVTGIAYDITKSLFKKAWEAILKFIERNSAIDIQPLEFVFNDVTICIEDVRKNNYAYLALLFQQLHHHINIMELNGVKEISYIRLPVVGEEFANLNVPEEVKCGQKFTDCIWYVKYDLGCSVCYYNSDTEKTIHT